MASKAQAEAGDELLQAVIISDSYNSRFKPLTSDKPRCLLPLANTPLIEYTLEFLASSGVKQVFIFVCVHANQIKDYIKKSKWSQSSSPFEVQFIPTPDSMSAGDAMRELDAKQLITSDFILLSGDVVSNMSVDEIVLEHRKRRETSKDSIMTMVVREANPQHRTRPKLDSAVFVLDSKTAQCISYTPTTHTKRIALELDLLIKHTEVEIRNDLIDCNIDICSPDVPALFTENFDYEDIRRDFVHGILTSDLLGKTIHCYVAKETYAARVQSLQTYDAVTRDVLSRWTYPMVPDNNLLSDQTYRYGRGHIYLENGVILARTTNLTSKVVIGRGSRIGNGTRISDSVLGRDNVIGDDCVIHDSYIWDASQIGARCKLSQCIVAENVVIGDDCTIEPGSILASGVNVPNNTTFSSKPLDNSQEDDEDGDDDDDEETESDAGLLYAVTNFHIDSDCSSINSLDSDVPEIPRGSQFQALAQADLKQAIAMNHSVDDTMLELTSLRMREDVSMSDVRVAMFAALTSHSGSPVRETVARWGPLLSRTVSSSTRAEDSKDLLDALHATATNEQLLPWIHALYDEDIVTEEDVLAWYNANPVKSLAGFVKWLQEAEEESDSDSDSD